MSEKGTLVCLKEDEGCHFQSPVAESVGLSVLPGGAGEDGRSPIDPLWKHAAVLEMVEDAGPQILGKGQAQLSSVASTTWVDNSRTRSYPFLRMKPSHTYGPLGFGHPQIP